MNTGQTPRDQLLALRDSDLSLLPRAAIVASVHQLAQELLDVRERETARPAELTADRAGAPS